HDPRRDHRVDTQHQDGDDVDEAVAAHGTNPVRLRGGAHDPSWSGADGSASPEVSVAAGRAASADSGSEPPTAPGSGACTNCRHTPTSRYLRAWSIDASPRSGNNSRSVCTSARRVAASASPRLR